MIPISPNQHDIWNYVEMKLYRHADPEEMSNDLWMDIVRVILEKISDNIIIVYLINHLINHQ